MQIGSNREDEAQTHQNNEYIQKFVRKQVRENSMNGQKREGLKKKKVFDPFDPIQGRKRSQSIRKDE